MIVEEVASNGKELRFVKFGSIFEYRNELYFYPKQMAETSLFAFLIKDGKKEQFTIDTIVNLPTRLILSNEETD